MNVIRNGFVDGWIPQVDIKQPVFWAGFALWFGFTGVVQLLRIAASIYRGDKENDRAQMPLFVLQFGWHIPFAVLLGLPLFVGWGVALVARN